jgi:hypothetical protein
MIQKGVVTLRHRHLQTMDLLIGNSDERVLDPL